MSAGPAGFLAYNKNDIFSAGGPEVNREKTEKECENPEKKPGRRYLFYTPSGGPCFWQTVFPWKAFRPFY
jgi:hypothetical protein